MDKIDQRLLYELWNNCRQTESKIAKKLKISKQVVNYRIKQLEKNRIIQGYHTYIDWRTLGYNAIRVYFKWQNISPEKEKAIYEEMKKDNFFMWIVKIEGEIDIGVYIWIKSFSAFAEKWFEFIAKHKQYLLRYEIYESVNMVHYPLKIFSETINHDEIIIGNTDKREEYDLKDNIILKEITKNARITLVELARKMKLSAKAVLYRMKNLEKKKIILGYYALINTDELGYKFYKVDFYLNDISQIRQLHEFAKQHKQIVYRMRTIGGPDFEIEVMVKEVTEVKKIINEIKIKFPKIIQHYRFHRLEYTIKQTYLPGE